MNLSCKYQAYAKLYEELSNKNTSNLSFLAECCLFTGQFNTEGYIAFTDVI